LIMRLQDEFPDIVDLCDPPFLWPDASSYSSCSAGSPQTLIALPTFLDSLSLPSPDLDLLHLDGLLSLSVLVTASDCNTSSDQIP
jgi:hypothetical protein